jgi:alkylation response protein AidB-like acyl-CoA dehydrogenase
VTFAFTDDQQELRSTAARFLEEKSSSEAVRELMETENGFNEDTWKQMGDLGWFGMAIPEEYGGIGFGFVEVTVLMEEMGKRLLCAPYFSSVILGANAILNAGSEDQKKELLPGIAEGSTRAALAFVEPSGKWSLVGSVNMDVRSKELNQENALGILDDEFAEEIERAFHRDLERAEEIDLERWRKRPLYHRVPERFFRLFEEQF